MTNYEKNIEALSSARPFIYDKLKNHEKTEGNVLCGDALDGEKFLAMNEKEKVFFDHRIPLHLIHCECTTETDLTGWQSGSDLSG